MKETILDYLSSNTGALTVQDILLNFLVAAVLGFAIFVSYRLSHSGLVYSSRFNNTLFGLTLITTLVMNVIGNNIALSLGMVGALSIIRFRTAIKDPRDTAYIFWCIAVGICCGVSEYMIAGIGTAFIFFFFLMLGNVVANDRYLLVIRGNGISDEMEKKVTALFAKGAEFRVENTTDDKYEFIYELSQEALKKANKSGNPVNALHLVEGVKTVNLICQNEDVNR